MLSIFQLSSTLVFWSCLHLTSRICDSNAMTVIYLSLQKAWSHHSGILVMRLHRKTTWREKGHIRIPSEIEGPRYASYAADPRLLAISLRHQTGKCNILGLTSVQSSHQKTIMLSDSICSRTGTSWSKSTQRIVREKKKKIVVVCSRQPQHFPQFD